MATYYPSLSGRGDNFQTPYPVYQKQAFYSELPSYVSNMTIYNQPTAAGSYLETMFPSECCLSSQNAAEIPAVEARNEMLFIPPTSGTMDWNGKLHTGAGTTVSSSLNGDPQAVPRSDHGIVDGEQNFHCQGLSLSLGTQMQAVPVSAPSLEHHFPSAFSTQLPSGGNQNNLQCFLGQKNAHNNNEANDMSCYGNTMLACKYLKAAQELLDEVVSVRKALKKQKSKKSLDISKDSEVRPSNQSDHIESTADSSSELSPDERQDLQNKKTKLLSMLDEVDRRYKQYYHQMQTLESSFDMVAGHGAAKSYTALALQTISRHLRCLCDAISGQIEVIRKRIGEQDNSSNSQINIPRLRYVDHQLRQQRALQQLGVMQHAWRPQRGLPESSVLILRAWLFEHFLHPYPNDTEKLKLAKQTGLTKNQVANWFINARVRLWKPMVEEMYKEEFGDSKTKSKSFVDDADKPCGENNLAPVTCPEELQECVTSRAAEMNASKDHNLLQNNSLGLKVTESEIMKLNSEKRLDIDDHSLYPGEKFSRDQNVDGRLISDTMAYGISELSGFAVGNHVSLALGLQPHENEAFAVPAAAHIRGNNRTSSVGPEAMDYLCMNHGKQQDRFGNAHLLSDFAV